MSEAYACFSCEKGWVLVTTQAVEQFEKHWKKHCHSSLENPDAKIVELFGKSVSENLDGLVVVRRLISNHFQVANYYYLDSWRFVVTEATLLDVIPVFVIETVERDRFGFQKSRPRFHPMRPNKKEYKRAYKALRE